MHPHASRLGGAGNLICPVSDQSAVGSGDLLHRDREGDGECGESHAVHQGHTH